MIGYDGLAKYTYHACYDTTRSDRLMESWLLQRPEKYYHMIVELCNYARRQHKRVLIWLYQLNDLFIEVGTLEWVGKQVSKLVWCAISV